MPAASFCGVAASLEHTPLRALHPSRRESAPQSLRSVLTTVACLLLILFASTAQAAHTHGKLLPQGLTQVSAIADGQHILAEDLCPLCAAMHSALPTPAVPPLRVALEKSPQAPDALRFGHSQAWSFDLFSRPPPTLV